MENNNKVTSAVAFLLHLKLYCLETHKHNCKGCPMRRYGNGIRLDYCTLGFPAIEADVNNLIQLVGTVEKWYKENKDEL